MMRCLAMLLTGWLVGCAMSAERQPFVLSATVDPQHRVVLTWLIQAGHELHDHFVVTDLTGAPLPLTWQIQGEHARVTEDKPARRSYQESVRLLATWHGTAEHNRWRVSARGCAAHGVCHPPLVHRLAVAFDTEGRPKAVRLLPDAAVPPEPDDSRSWYRIGLVYFFSGLLLSLTPCHLPMVPILSQLLLGERQLSRSRGFYLALAYVAGMSLTYAGWGVASAAMGYHVGAWLQRPSVLLGFTVLWLASWHLDGALPAGWRRGSERLLQWLPQGTYSKAVTMGVLATMVVSPCVTPALALAVGYVGLEPGQTSLLQSGLTLWLWGLGLGVPLLLLGSSLGHWLPRRGAWMQGVHHVATALMGWFIIALWIPWLPESWVLLCRLAWLWGLGLLWLFWWRHRWWWPCLWLVVGTLYLIDPMDRTQPITTVRSVTALQAALVQRCESSNLVMYTAQWCTNCRWFEQTVLPQPDVQQWLRDVVVIKADVTQFNEHSKALLNHHRVLGPPTYLLLDCHGQEQARLSGRVSASMLQQWLQQHRLAKVQS